MKELSPVPLLVDSLGDLRRTWPQMVLTDLMARALAVVIITPLVGLLIKLFLWRTATGVITDVGIAAFVLHPIGMTAIVVVGAVALGVLFAETGQLMVIGFGAIEDRRVTWLDALIYTYRRSADLLQLAGRAVVRLLLIAAPFAVALTSVYWLLLRSHDINFYLASKPPEYLVAVAAAGVLLAVMGLIIASKIAAWLLSLPMVLFEGTTGKQALRSSGETTRPYRRAFTAWLLGWLLGVSLVSWVATSLLGWVGGFVVSRTGANLTLLLVGLSLVTIIGILTNLMISIATTVVFPLIVVRVYRTLAGAGELRPGIRATGSLGDRASFKIPGKLIVVAAAAALAIVVVGSVVVIDEPDWHDPTEIIAHRGGAAVAPENTLAAFERGIADHADWLELDVQENADGVVVIEHDRDFMRAAGSSLEVYRATADDLADLDIGSSFAPDYSNQRVPALRDVLELAKGRVGVVIELKYYGHDVELEQKVVDLVEATGMTGQIVIMSLDYDGLRKTAALRPEWTYGLLNTVALGDLTGLDVDFLALNTSAASRAMIRHAHNSGIRVYAWTIDDPVRMWVMMSRGIDGIITDRVAMANRVKKIRAQVGPAGRLIVWIAGETGLLRGVGAASTENDA